MACQVLVADLSRAGSVDALAAACSERDVSLLVAAAGYGTSGRFVGNPLGEETAMIDLNCRAVVELSHFYGGRFVSRGSGGIVLLSSILAFQGVPLAASYAATKAFVQVFAEGLRRELSDSGVDVLAVAPGPVASGFASRPGLEMTTTCSPATVARASLSALGRRTTVRPGFLSKVLDWSLSTLPRALRTRVMGRVMTGMQRT